MDLKKICPLCLRAGKRDRRPKECLYLWGVEDGAEATPGTVWNGDFSNLG